MFRDSFNLLCSEDQRLLPDFMRKWGWFHRHDVRFPKNLGSRLKFQKTKTWVCGWKSNDYNINIFLSLENPCTFLLAKEQTWKHIFKTNSELSQNHTEKQFMPSKLTVNWQFNDICYLVIGCFNWKLRVFQQIVVRFYYILKYLWSLSTSCKIYTWKKRIKCRIPGTKPTYSPVNFTKEHVGHAFF